MGVPSPMKELDETHVKEVELVHRALDKTKPRIVLGDFNSLAAMRAPEYLKEHGFTDSFAAVTKNPESQITWKWNWRGALFKYRFDYIFHSAEMTTRQSRVIENEASDHYPVVSTLRWRAKSTD